MKAFLGGILMLAFVPASLMALNVVYTNNDLTAANTVSAYSVDTNGTMSILATYSTGGKGTAGSLYSADRIIIVKTSLNNTFLYASNAGSNDVSGFALDPTTGALTLVSPTPYPTGTYNDGYESGISLAATPDGKYLYAGSTGFSGQITIFQIDPSTGALTANPTLMQADGPMTSMKVSPTGGLLVAAIKDYDEIQTFKIGSNGALAKVGATFGTAPFTGVDVDCAGTHLYAGAAGPNVQVFSIDPSTGALTYLSSSPPVGTISSNQVVRLSPDDSVLYASNQGSHSVTAFNVDSTSGALTGGTAVGTGDQYAYPGGLAVNADGTFLYAGSAQPALTVFGLGGVVPFVRDSYNALAPQTYGMLSVAAYPPKACSVPTSLSATLEVSAGPPPSFDLSGTFDLGSGGAADPLTQPVTLAIGDYSVTIPAGSFTMHQDGTNAGIYVFQGVIAGTTLKVQITALGSNQFQILAFGKQVDLAGLANPVLVQVTIDSSSSGGTITATETDSLRGLWTAQ
ncbi:MAG TPA: beta-propeller fold lactonase family protein [Terriglobia bacterium]|nr:beta-propeller fold lactonase family protein [Terriglobia bacterium]